MSDQLRYPMIRRAISETPWAILPEKLNDIMEFVAFKSMGGDLTAEEIRARLGASTQRQAPQASGSVAVLSILGTISNRASLLTEASGGVSVDGLRSQFRELVDNPKVGAIVLDMDSPGGSASGIDEMAAEIYAARGRKPIIAVANTLMASAAYWLAASADEIVVTPSALVGSIGVIASHEDQSAMYEKLGVKVSLVSAGKYKAENNPFEPMTEDGQAAIQHRVDEMYAMFVNAVARGRGVSADAVRNGFGEGRVVGAQEAVQLGMADRIATIDDVIATIPTTTESGTSAMAAGLVAVPYEAHGQRVLADLTSFMQATRDRAAHRREEGRTLSAAHRGRLLDLHAEMTTLLAETEPLAKTLPPELFRVGARFRDLDLRAAESVEHKEYPR